MTALWITEDDLDDPTSPDAREAARVASMVLYALSGRKYSGIQTVVEFYEPADRCGCSSDCSIICGRRPRLRLRGQPVRTVTELVLNWETDPTVIPSSEYKIIDRTYLRPAHNASWSACRQLKVTYSFGSVVPEMGLRAARILGNEILKSISCPDQCGLPDRVTSISRQGVSFTVLDPQDFLKDGRTGLYEVDLFLKAVNPDNARKRARVFSPDVPRASRDTTPPPGP